MHVPAYLVNSETKLEQLVQLGPGWTSTPAKRPSFQESVRSRSRGRALLLHCGLLGRSGAAAGVGAEAGAGAGAGAGAQSPASCGDGDGGSEGKAHWLACRAKLKVQVSV